MIRYLRWTLICRRGRLCARLTVTPVDSLPAGYTPVVQYTCGGCGTTYRRRGWEEPVRVP